MLFRSREVDETILKRQNLNPVPELNEFVDRLSDYISLSPKIRHHALPQVNFIGHDFNYYDRIYSFGELNALSSDIEKRTGIQQELPHEQRSKQKFAHDLSETSIAKLTRFYAEDLDFLKRRP